MLGMMDDLPEVAMMAYDRHLDVVGATLTARALHPIYRPGTNLARFTYLDGHVNRDLDDWNQKADSIAAALRASLRVHPEDATFLTLVGELTASSEVFADAWARDTQNPREVVVLIRHGGVGVMRLTQRQLHLGEGSEDTLVVLTGSDAESRAKLASLREMEAD